MPAEPSVLLPGPWTHREISANGTRFHAAEMGTGPLVLLLHGFPQFWWTWRNQLTGLAAAGFRAVAPDLRGYGASDKPPRGYDAFTLSADVAGMVRALGERDAVVVGHDWGGLLAWTAATLHPSVVSRLAVLAMPHPRRMLAGLLTDPRGQLRASWYVGLFQVPRLAERRITDDDAAFVGRLLHAWSAPGWPEPTAERRYRDAVRIPGVAHCAMEYYRWAVRSQVRPDGARYRRLLAAPVTVPTLQVHGGRDGATLASTAAGSGRYVAASYDWLLLPGVGHFPHEESAEAVTSALLSWASRR